jgi:hypothetical protein
LPKGLLQTYEYYLCGKTMENVKDRNVLAGAFDKDNVLKQTNE